MIGMMWFIQQETDYGPFFSDIEIAEGYLRHDCQLEEAQITRALAGTDPYINVVEVILDDTSVSFDG